MSILNVILQHKQEEIEAIKKRGVTEPAIHVDSPRGFIKALLQEDEVSIIAEVKKASPSKGLICPNFDSVKMARDYEEGGARAISVLTDERFFQGSISFLPLIRSQVSLPLLRKDFIIDHIQIEQAKIWGADAILLIVAALSDMQLQEFMAHAKELGMDCLTEVHDEEELERAIKSDAELIGVNNRNLKDFTVSLETTFRLRKIAPASIPMVSESGIATFDHMQQLKNAGIVAALIGETLVKSPDRRDMLKTLRGK
ncbi:MAG: indole-3-glycerol phosphate synthase TrpC [Dissulfuribacterales bacterium]